MISSRILLLCPLLSGLLLLSIAGFASAQNSADGTLTVDGETTEIRYAYAHEFDGDITVVLTDSELPREIIPDGTYAYGAAGEFRGVIFSVSADSQALQSGGWYELVKTIHFHPIMNEQGDIGSPTLSTSQFDTDILAGSISTGGVKTVADHEVSYDASFSVSLKPEPIEVTFTGDDSEPSKAFAEWTKALFAGDIESFKKYVSNDIIEMIPTDEAEIAEGLEFQQLMMPNNIDIESAEVDGSKAVLKMTGRRGMEVSRGTVNMMLEDGEWKVGEQSWESGDME